MAIASPPGIPAPSHNTMYSDPQIGPYVRDFQVNLDSFVGHVSGTYIHRIHELEEQLKESKSVNSYLMQRVHETENKYTEATKGLSRRVVCLVDGDGSIFSLAQVARGKDGGHDVALQLTEAIRGHNELQGLDPFVIHTWVFFNKAGLSETLRRCGKEQARQNLDEFVHGFNQAAERFMMVDIGHGKEMADAKIRAYLEGEIKSPQTVKVLFSGCHDSGYLTSIRSLITDGYRQKLVLLQGYDQMAFGYASLELPTLTAPDLFEHDKLVVPSPTASIASGSPRRPSAAAATRPATTWAAVAQHSKADVPASPPPPQTPGYQLRRNGTMPTPGARHLDRTKPLHKQNPPPCNMFYLAHCKYETGCTYAHDYLLEAEDYEAMRVNAKKSPCVVLNRGDVCVYGDNCVHGHKCPFGPGCFYYQRSECKFTAVGMHTAE